MIDKKKQTKENLFLIYGFIFVIFAVLVYLAPYVGDDWSWGSELGLERLNSNFENYNGRYLGNTLVMIITRSELVCVLVMALSFLFMCCLPGMFFGSNNTLFILLSVGMVFLFPRYTFHQTIVWAAGYSNYVPPILLSTLYFVLIRNIFEKETPTYKKWLPPVAFIIATATALFMEHATIYSFAMSFMILIYVYVKFKKVYFSHIAYFLGSIAGAVIMFTNSAYGLIANASDAQGGYRSTILTSDLFEMLKANINNIGTSMFINNIPLLIVVCILANITAISHLKKVRHRKTANMISASIFVNVLSLIILFTKENYPSWSIAMWSNSSEIITLAFFTSAMILYYLSICAIVLLCVKDQPILQKMIFILIGIPVVTAPLTVVSPVTARCFYPQCFLFIVLSVFFLGYIKQTVKITPKFYKTITAVLGGVVAAVVIFMFSIYSTIYVYAEKRDEYIQKQVDSGETVITVCELPHPTYLFLTGTPSSDLWAGRFKMFYDLDQSLQFEILPYNEFDEWAEKYDSTEVKK